MSTGCQIIKKGGFPKKAVCDVIALTVRDRLKERGTSKGSERKRQRKREKFLPGALKVLELRMHGFAVVRFQFVHAK